MFFHLKYTTMLFLCRKKNSHTEKRYRSMNKIMALPYGIQSVVWATPLLGLCGRREVLSAEFGFFHGDNINLRGDFFEGLDFYTGVFLEAGFGV